MGEGVAAEGAVEVIVGGGTEDKVEVGETEGEGGTEEADGVGVYHSSE